MQVDIKEDLATCRANLRGSKTKDILATAQALKRLKSESQWNSNKKLAQEFLVSPEMIREFLSITRLPSDIQSLFSLGTLKLEHGRRLWQLSKTRSDILLETARAMRALTAHDSRHLAEYLRKNPESSVSDAMQRLEGSKATVSREYHVVAILTEEEFRQLDKMANARGIAADRLVTAVVQSWLTEHVQ